MFRRKILIFNRTLVRTRSPSDLKSAKKVQKIHEITFHKRAQPQFDETILNLFQTVEITPILNNFNQKGSVLTLF